MTPEPHDPAPEFDPNAFLWMVACVVAKEAALFFLGAVLAFAGVNYIFSLGASP